MGRVKDGEKEQGLSGRIRVGRNKKDEGKKERKKKSRKNIGKAST